MAKYLINDDEVNALRNVVQQHKMKRAFDALGYDKKKIFANFPLRFKSLAAMHPSTENPTKNNVLAHLYFLGDAVGSTVDNFYVNQGYYEPIIDDSSAFRSFPEGTIGTVVGSSEFFITSIESAISYMGLATADYTSDSTVVNIDSLEAMDGIATTLTNLDSNNKFHFTVTENKYCFIKWNMYSSGYDLIQTECP